MIQKFILCITVLATLAQVPAFSQQYTFTLEEAVNFALDSNYTALNARRDMAIALKQKWETTATGLPQISGSIGYNYNIKQPVTLIPGEIAGGDPGTFVPVTFGTQQNANAVATLNQLIFDGSYLVGLQAARAFLDFSENAAEKTNLEVRKGVINAYGSVLLAQQLIEIFEKNKDALDKNLFETREIFKNGLTEEESVEQLEITLLDINTQLSNAQRSLSIAKQMFNVALGIDVESQVVFADDLDTLTQQNISLNLLDTDLNVENNIDYKIAYNLTEQRSLEMKLEKSFALPTLKAFVNYGTQANSNEFTFFDGNQRWFQSSILGVNMDIPIFSSGKRSAATQRRRIALDKAETQLKETIQNVTLQLNTAKSNYQFAVEKFDNSKKNLNLAERIENKNQIKFTEGLASSFELRQAQTQLYSAQQQFFEAMLDVINSKATLETVLNIPQLRVSASAIND
jgi:outer membrane protein TolC